MRKILTVVMLLTAFAGMAQKKKKGQAAKPKAETAEVKPVEKAVVKPVDTVKNEQPVNPFIEHYVKKYTLATRWGDQVAVKEALLDLIAETGNDSLAYTLGVYYYENGQYAPSILISQDLLKRTPKNVSILQLAGAGYEALGLREKALPHYESIYMANGNTSVLYKMVTLQFETKRFAEARTNIEILLTKPDLDSLKVQEGEGKNIKEFPVRAAIYNIKGLVLQQTGDKPGAKKAFETGLAIAPAYNAIKENLAKLK